MVSSFPGNGVIPVLGFDYSARRTKVSWESCNTSNAISEQLDGILIRKQNRIEEGNSLELVSTRQTGGTGSAGKSKGMVGGTE